MIVLDGVRKTQVIVKSMIKYVKDSVPGMLKKK